MPDEMIDDKARMEVKDATNIVTETTLNAHKGDYGVLVVKEINCKQCGENKPKTEYYSANRGVGGYVRQPCKPCRRTQRRADYRSTGEADRVHARNLARYGLSVDDYDRMLADQNGGCATCCRTPAEQGRRLAVDHDHVTGKVRALLCHFCNVTVGCIETKGVPVDVLVAYLARHRGAAS